MGRRANMINGISCSLQMGKKKNNEEILKCLLINLNEITFIELDSFVNLSLFDKFIYIILIFIV